MSRHCDCRRDGCCSRRPRHNIIVTNEIVRADNDNGVRNIILRAFSNIPQVVDFDENCCLNILSAKTGEIHYCESFIEICIAGSYQIDFSSIDDSDIPFALTVNHRAAPGVVYKNPVAVNTGCVILDLVRGDKVALTNKFSFDPIAVSENIISTSRMANIALSITRLSD